MNKNLSFSGHESFACKYFWLKKGYDFICDAHSFTKADAVMQLGVGKNMVSAIRFWLRAFGLTNDKDELQDIAHTIFKDDNGDPYLEDIGTVWLLHYLLVTTDRASIYSFVFNDFRKNHIEFSRDDLMRAIEYKCKEIDKSHIYNTNTVTTDISVFIRNYQRKHQKVVALNIEDDFSGILLDLNLLKMVDRADTKEVFYFNTEHRTIPLEILLYGILNKIQGSTIDFNHLLSGEHQIGSVFLLNAEQLHNYLTQLTEKYPFLTLTENAGKRILQVKSENDPTQFITQYYAKNVQSVSQYHS